MVASARIIIFLKVPSGIVHQFLDSLRYSEWKKIANINGLLDFFSYIKCETNFSAYANC